MQYERPRYLRQLADAFIQRELEQVHQWAQSKLTLRFTNIASSQITV